MTREYTTITAGQDLSQEDAKFFDSVTLLLTILRKTHSAVDALNVVVNTLAHVIVQSCATPEKADLVVAQCVEELPMLVAAIQADKATKS